MQGTCSALPQVAEAGAGSAAYVLLRLPNELKAVWREWLELHYPERAAHVMSLLQQLHGGRDYDSDFATRMKGSGIWADLLRQRFAKACDRLGYQRQRVVPDVSLFRPAALSGQGDLF